MEKQKVSLKKEIYKVILEENLKTFRSKEVRDNLKTSVGYRRIGSELDKITEETRLCKVGSEPNTYSFRSYQRFEALDDLEINDRIAVDELVQSILQRDTLNRKEVKKMVGEFNNLTRKVAKHERINKVEYYFQELPFIKYNKNEEVYKCVI